jgi:hypothetical protein
MISRAARLLGGGTAGDNDHIDDLNAGLEVLQGLVLAMPALGVGGPWKEVDVIADYMAGEDERIRVQAGYSANITYPNTVPDFPRVPGTYDPDPIAWIANGGPSRPPRDGARVRVIGTAQEIRIYCADAGEWRRADNLTLNGEPPFSAGVQYGLTAMLAVNWAPEFPGNKTIRPEPAVVAAAAEGDMLIRTLLKGPAQLSGVDPSFLAFPSNRRRTL